MSDTSDVRVAHRDASKTSGVEPSVAADRSVGPAASVTVERVFVGAIAGGIAAVLFSVVVPPQDMMPMVAALYGLDGMVWGWLFHLAHGLVFGAIFAAATAAGPVRSSLDDLVTSTAAGAVYGFVVWLVFAVFVMPAWIGAVTDMSPPVPDWNRLSLVAHLVYGAGLGALVPMAIRRGRRIG